MERKNKVLFWFLAVLTVTGVVFSGWQIFVEGTLSWHIRQPQTLGLFVEMSLVFLLLLVIMIRGKSAGIRLAGTGLVTTLFLWCHVNLLPVLFAALYLAYCYGAGFLIRSRILRLKLKEAWLLDGILGCAVVILSFCVMSAAGIGAIPYLRIFVLVTGLPVAVWSVRQIMNNRERISGWLDGWQLSARDGLFLAFILTMVLLQAGRMNTAVDFDTRWYSVRSEYILNNGHGIYENLGSIAVVYTYSKGWEVLTLPFSSLPSHSFLLSFNLWFGVIALLAAYRAAIQCMGRSQAKLVPVLMAGVPGVVNMCISGKTDIFTLAVQMSLILYVLIYIRKKETVYLIAGACCMLFSWMLKPTALLFSTAVFGMSGLYVLFTKRLKFNGPARQWWLFLPFAATLVGICARTVILVGVPFTSIFSAFFTKLGFQMKYPYLIWDVPNHAGALSFTEQAGRLLKRLYGVFLAPTAAEMSRVLISWGGIITLFLLFVWLLFRSRRQRREEEVFGLYFPVVLIPFIIVSIVSIMQLKQTDGNYYLLLYSLAILCGCRFIGSLTSALKRAVHYLLIPVLLLQVMVIGCVNLAWELGLTPISLKHPGYYNHEALERQYMAEQGNAAIWDILASDPQTRVISLGIHPDTLTFPCNVQSYADISTSNGNVELVETAETFLGFMKYAKTDYIYMQADFMGKTSHNYQLICQLIAEGKLTDLKYEHGNVLALVDADGQESEKSQAELTRFLEQYKLYTEES